MNVINFKNAYLSLNTLIILNNAELKVKKKERICLTGKNGVGKSTLLEVISKRKQLDQGIINYRNELSISYLQQNIKINLQQTIYNYISTYNNTKDNFKNQNIINHINKLNIKKNIILNNKLLTNNNFESNIFNTKYKIDKIINELNLNKYEKLSNLSRGNLQKIKLAKVILNNPDLLLLDEPTNHLDLQTIIWLENFCKNFSGSILFISHDRIFIENIATRIVNLEHGKILEFFKNYNHFIEFKNNDSKINITQNKKFKKKLDQEQKWLKQSVKARCRRNEGRVKKFKVNQNIYINNNRNENTCNININYSSYNKKIICKIRNITLSINQKNIFNNFSDTIINGDKIALIGNNGSGKSTMIKTILGQLIPNTGTIKLSANLNIAYFDQECSMLNMNQTILENLTYGKYEIMFNGKQKGIISYLQDFLFSKNQILSPINKLSGGEKSRLLLAKIFLMPSNLLILDEPTNNLDIETMKLLENAIINYPGTVILVSHDRKFINNIVSKCWYLNNKGNIYTHIGGYSEFLYHKFNKNNLNYTSKKLKNNINLNPSILKKNIKLSYHLQKELNNFPSNIEKLENEIFNLQTIIQEKKFFIQNSKNISLKIKELNNKETELQSAYEKWNLLEKLKINKN
ncbi:ATP-binding protein Uup [Buchnera aphidicola (Eriosoma lanigerum)]|uniref:ATP-binding cassette domain-containing protein n=1 Tax=Buchnera aphidicola TaxID=9 RepID=UPI00346427A3